MLIHVDRDVISIAYVIYMHLFLELINQLTNYVFQSRVFDWYRFQKLYKQQVHTCLQQKISLFITYCKIIKYEYKILNYWISAKNTEVLDQEKTESCITLSILIFKNLGIAIFTWKSYILWLPVVCSCTFYLNS